MGSSCSSGQAHKDKDSVSTKSEESPAYQVIVKKASDAAAKDIEKNHTNDGSSSNAGPPLPSCVRQLTASVSDSASIPSPPTMSPRESSEPTLPDQILHLSESFQTLVWKIDENQTISTKTRKIVLYVCAADSQDCCVEKGVLHEVVVPELRAYCRDKGYELHITDLHWRTGLEKQQDHEFPELCLEELTRQMEVAYVIPVLFLSNSLGTPLLPKTVETQDFEMALCQAEDKDSLRKWYRLDADAQPPCYRLLPVASHIPSFKENSWEQQEQALTEWRTEIERTLTAMVTAFSEELRNTYLTTVVEQEVHNTILMSQELARRCLWIYRVYTQRPDTSQNPSITEKEQKRRLDILYKDLRSQLTEKHVVRLSVKWQGDAGIDKSIPEHAQYISDVTSHLMKYLKAIIFNIIDEDQTKAVVRSQYGIEAAFLNELKWQAIFCQKTAQSSIQRDNLLQHIQKYITGDSTQALLVDGGAGSGKTTLVARAVHSIHSWQPDAFLVYRFTRISTSSFTLLAILKSVCEHLSLLTPPYRLTCPHTLAAYEEALVELVHSISIRRPVVIALDGLDQLEVEHLHWLPSKLPNNAKIIISATTDSKLAQLFRERVSGDTTILELRELNQSEAEELLMSSVTQYSHSVSSSAAECVKSAVRKCTLPLYVKVVAWRSSWNSELKLGSGLHAELNAMLDYLDHLLDKNRLKITFSLLTLSKYGLRDSELLDILSKEPAFHSDTTYLKWAPACIHLSQLTKYLHPFLHWVSDGNNLTLRIVNRSLQDIVEQRYVLENKQHIVNLVKSYFKCKELQTLAISAKSVVGCCKRRQLIEVPYQSIQAGDNIDELLLDPKWLFEKICQCNVFEVLDDIQGAIVNSSRKEDLEIMKGILERRHIALNHDGKQWFSQLHEECVSIGGPSAAAWLAVAQTAPSLSLIPNPREPLLDGDSARGTLNSVLRLPTNPNYVVSVSTSHQELCVWNVHTCERVRVITGVTQPVSIQMIDDIRAVVLCGRELRIYDLDKGVLLKKMKGLMHQKMAFFGLHDSQHLVALSRNRMYVNLMNIETGDCVTTFKAGEDRFLNSLLVSGDGRILVCGDETQKPFPLLVWSLTSRKLLYDLRIPHHEFLTNLNAITHEGHYVCCVAKEVDEPGCNFIVVYDLQSGTLFKKWKPGVDTTCLDISSKDSCVISGMADARILVWDLVTGNCRWGLRGHSAPVTLVRRDPAGGRFMSADHFNRDRSIRLWCLSKGDLLAVYTPQQSFTACELAIGGNTVVLALEGSSCLNSFDLRGPGLEAKQSSEAQTYGDEANHDYNLVMEQLYSLTTQNPLTRLVSSYMMTCPGGNCSGHGECMNGTCFCEIQYDGEECHAPNMPYYIGFATVFFLLAFVCMVQLIMCVVAEYYRMKSPSVLRACRVTTQKLLYFVVFLAAVIRGAYFTSPTAFHEGWSSSLMSAYYPLLLSSSSLIVCLWAEVFHLRDIRWDRPQFLSKSFLGFVTFNILTYSLLAAEFITTNVSMTPEKKLLQQHIFNGCYAVLLFIVVVFFLIYGVEVFFKVRGGFLVDPVSNIANRAPADEKERHTQASLKLCSTLSSMQAETGVDMSQLHQSRLGLVSQACMLIIVVGFLFSETLSEFWKEKAPIYTRNWHDVTFRIVEIGVVLWFPCVLWNCMSPDQLWILNPKKLLKRLEPPAEAKRDTAEKDDLATDNQSDTCPLVDCWICYDPERTDAGPLIQPCKCSGDVSSVHHDCLRRWLVESSTDSKDGGLTCKVCKAPYEVTRSSKLDWQLGFTSQHWLRTTVIVTVMCVAGASAWAVIQLFTDPYIRMLAASSALLVIYVCIRFLGVNTAEAYQRARVSGINIMGNVATVSGSVSYKKNALELEEVHQSTPPSVAASCSSGA